MTVFADYEYYIGQYLQGRKATIETAFNYYARKATQEIKQFTLDNVNEESIPKCVRLCCCEVAELLYRYDNSGFAGGVTSEKVGDVSRSYESTDSQRQALSKNIRSVVYSWLSGTGFLYRGVYKC